MGTSQQEQGRPGAVLATQGGRGRRKRPLCCMQALEVGRGRWHPAQRAAQWWHCLPGARRKAWNCLAVRDSGELQQGIELSKRLQRAILRCAAPPGLDPQDLLDVPSSSGYLLLSYSSWTACMPSVRQVNSVYLPLGWVPEGAKLQHVNTDWCLHVRMRSDGGLLIVSKAGQERARFRWFDMTRNEVSNKVCTS